MNSQLNAFNREPEERLPGAVPSAEHPRDKIQKRTPPVRRPAIAEFAGDVARGLSSKNKFIPSKYLYDSVGSALFEAICHLREYKCSRGETRLLHRHGADILSQLAPATIAVELGGGSGAKALVLLSQESSSASIAEFHNIDISTTALQRTRLTLSALPHITLHTHEAAYLKGLSQVTAERRAKQPILVLFLGSSIGNYEQSDAQVLLDSIRGQLQPGDHLLLGTDLVKQKERLLKAYDDPQGVTAAFNKNILAHVNSQLAGNFDLSSFRHEARWNPNFSRIEMHLVSAVNQCVEITRAAMLVRFAKNETIHTEHSYKFQREQVGPWLHASGFDPIAQWCDEPSLFATTLARVR